MHRVRIEAALNGPWSRTQQPGIPDTVGGDHRRGRRLRARRRHDHSHPRL
jgi:hypothetical protein